MNLIVDVVFKLFHFIVFVNFKDKENVFEDKEDNPIILKINWKENGEDSGITV